MLSRGTLVYQIMLSHSGFKDGRETTEDDKHAYENIDFQK